MGRGETREEKRSEERKKGWREAGGWGADRLHPAALCPLMEPEFRGHSSLSVMPLQSDIGAHAVIHVCICPVVHVCKVQGETVGSGTAVSLSGI